ncbi:hypothetical protein VFPFJ_00862 [Purpureocillium lilacinum]|uniref:Uncharacterized protein n=1 Tax=Purpureocillium lilacinum TaxID=33203 RepID=A0A179HZL9_PURLI|nr:hypothetical protein VFPFJ_00862 [Purpureocillium lilacinum]OAQ94753.1 hypothetical protein VFPFJ_00862 [Purpureocillium lilacinum]
MTSVLIGKRVATWPSGRVVLARSSDMTSSVGLGESGRVHYLLIRSSLGGRDASKYEVQAAGAGSEGDTRWNGAPPACRAA